ncbi:MAG TPA: tRNA pseudouridine(55) synthase TruB [Polyangiaceae bacterium]|nr:tRNA pseudouridine(55) synthase TruB [Polyangiaceae bacterium]
MSPVQHGLWIVDKPSGPTSHDIVAGARRQLGTRRVGHAGTLDPMASGVLVLLIGEATKLSDVATSEDKGYVTEVRFGRGTDSFDAEGQTTVQATLASGWLDASRLADALEQERQRTEQVPPTVSAVKVAGQRAYRLTRDGRAPELAPRPVAIHALTLLDWSSEFVQLALSVSKGYYVRSLARDLGHVLGAPAHLSRLRRVQSGRFRVEDACAWPPASDPRVIPLRDALPRLLPTARLTAPGVDRARQGKALSVHDFLDPPAPEAANAGVTLAWTDAEGTPVALGRRDGDTYRVRRGFAADALLA